MIMEYPDSVEEAAALLGATITKCTGGNVHPDGRNISHSNSSSNNNNSNNIHEAILPPLGMHPAFAVVVTHHNSHSSSSSSNNHNHSGIGSTTISELVHRLYQLRSLLRTAADTGAPLAAAPSILQVLKKLLGVSTQVAAAAGTHAVSAASSTAIPTTIAFTSSISKSNSNSSSNNAATLDATTAVGTAREQPNDAPPPKQRRIVLPHKYDTPPLWSTPCRILWVDCVVLCHALSTASNSNDVTLFVRQMLALASIHPRSVKAGGGVRIAALSVIAALLEHEDVASPEQVFDSTKSRPFTLATKLAPWSLDILQVCLKALRSAGNGEPTFRDAAIRAACATATACRNAARKNRQMRSDDGSGSNSANTTHTSGPEDFCLPGAMEDKAIAESIKILKQAATDKFPEVRSGAATFAITLAPLLIAHNGSSSGSTADPLHSLEEVMQLALRNLDDESLVVADGWAEAMARCLCTSIQYSDAVKASTQSAARNTSSGEGGGDGAETSGASVAAASPTAATSRFGTKKFSGMSHTLTTHSKVIHYLVEQFVKAGGELVASKCGGLYSTGGRAVRLGWCMTLARFLRIQSAMSAIGESRSVSMHSVILAVLDMVKEQDHHTRGTSIARSTSVSDITLCRLFALRVLRYGLTELAPESVQLGILQELVALLPTNKNAADASSQSQYPLKENQIQVVLVEVSNLIVALGEAAGSRIDDLKASLDICLVSSNIGIRYEASVLCVAVANMFPSFGVDLIHDSLEVIQQQLAQIVEAIPAEKATTEHRDKGSSLFGKATTKGCLGLNESNESAILGRSLVISMLTKAMPNHPEGFPRSALAEVLKVAEMLVSSQFNELLTTSSPSTVCSLVRAGFAILSGVLTTGPDAVEAHMSEIMNAWKKTGNAAKNGGKKMSLAQDLSCVESALTSVTVFLKYCSELLLIIPEALSQVSMLLEDIFPLLQANGRLGKITNDDDARVLLENATATLLEAFAWLPSGSFPLVADEVFSFAEEKIRKSVEDGIVCSILDSLIAKHDNILDLKTFCRTGKDTKLFGARDFEDASSLISDEIALYSERESVYHLRSDLPLQPISESKVEFCGSSILEYFANDNDVNHKPPTPLHEVGTWRRPVNPSCSSKVRLVDAAIQAFSATFGLKDGKEQQGAMNLLEILLPQSLCHFARTIGISSMPTEPEKRSKGKDDLAAAINITAVLLSCLQALPLHEATHNIPIGLGPPWMNKAKVLLLTLLPSSSTNVRRASAEGLALLATLGVTEDAHFLQSALLHSLDEIMQSNKPDGKARTLSLDHVSAARAGSLLALACIQRTANNVAKRKLARARGRLYGNNSEQAVDKSSDNLPVLQMMTRILPSAACHGFKEHFIVKTYALYAFTVLLMYSTRLSAAVICEEDKQLIRKGIELVDDNFSSSWTAASSDTDRGQDTERLDCEIAFVTALLRLMTYLLPFLHHIRSEDSSIARRFAVFATVVLENLGYHPYVFVEASAFFEVSCTHQNMYPKLSKKLRYTENAMVACLPSIVDMITPSQPDPFGRNVCKSGNFVSFRISVRTSVFLLRCLPLRNESDKLWNPMMVSSILLATLEVACGSRRNEPVIQTVATNRQVKHTVDGDASLINDIFVTFMDLLLHNVHTGSNKQKRHLLRCILLARQLLTRFSLSVGIGSSKSDIRETVVKGAMEQAIKDGSFVYNCSNTVRWQVKCLCIQLATDALQHLRAVELVGLNDEREASQFDLLTASNLFTNHGNSIDDMNDQLSDSRLVFHLEDVLSSACMSSVATVDQAELRGLQVNSMYFVGLIVECFGQIHDPEDPTKCILYQYLSQILSSVKSALSAPGKKQSKQLSTLFIAGCEVLQSIVQKQLITDAGVVKRLLSLVFPPENTAASFSYSEGFRAEFSYSDVDLGVRVMGMLTFGNILLGRRTNLEAEFVENIRNDMLSDRLGIATHLAAATVDGCRILFSQGLSLVGMPLRDTMASENIQNSGFFYENIDDLDEVVRTVLTSTWTHGAYSSVAVFIDQINAEDSDDTCRELCSTWINALLPLLLSGLYSGIITLVDETKQNAKLSCHMSIDPTMILNDCMHCIGHILCSERPASSEDFYDDIDAVINLTCDVILNPTLSNDEGKHQFEESAIKEACNLIKMYAHSSIFTLDRNPAFLTFLLMSLKLSVGDTSIERANQGDEVIVTCCLAISEMILQKKIETNGAVVKSMMHHSMTILISQSFSSREKIRDAAKVLLKTCLLVPSSSTVDDNVKVSCQLAANDLWEEWAMLIGLDVSTAYPSVFSVHILRTLLRNPNEHKSHAAALVGVRVLFQNSMTTSPQLIGRFFHDVGADIVHLCYTYGTLKLQPIDDAMLRHRTAICADSMKIILIVYRHLANENDEGSSNITSFLNIIFEVFLAVIRFNGLPNHPSPEKQYGDPSLGRICAQAILFVARTTPIPFKECVAMLPNDNHERTLLEYAVRAEMNGYVVAAPTTEPVKKKLNVKSFQK